MADHVLALQQAFASAPLALKVLAGVGGFLATRLALQLLAGVYAFFLRPSKNVTKFGKWAIVTGATDGIGKGLALELARKGSNVVLMSRTQKKLEEVRDAILAKYPKVQVEILAVDFTKIDEPSVRDAIKKVIAKVEDVGVLFNNVGVSYDFPEVWRCLLWVVCMYVHVRLWSGVRGCGCSACSYHWCLPAFATGACSCAFAMAHTVRRCISLSLSSLARIDPVL